MNYANIDLMWGDIAENLVEEGTKIESRDGPCREAIGYHGVLTNTQQNVLHSNVRQMSMPYAAAEIIWYLSGEETIHRIGSYAPQYKRFAEHGIAHGAYGKRWADNTSYQRVVQLHQRTLKGKPVTTQIAAIIALLKEKPDSRQAILSMWSAGDLAYAYMGNKKDIPCTLSIQFLVRESKLHCIVTMRSNDVWLGLPYDVFAFTTLQHLLAYALKLKSGLYIHNVGSMHLYNRNYTKALRVADQELNKIRPRHNWVVPADPISRCIRAAIDAEEFIRRRKCLPESFDDKLEPGTMLRDLVLCTASKWMGITDIGIHSDLIRKVLYANN